MGASDNFVFQNVRILYPALLRPKKNFAGDGEEYALVALIPKTDSDTVVRFTELYNRLATIEFKSVPPNLRPLHGLRGQKSVFKDGDNYFETAPVEKKSSFEPYRGHIFINLSIATDIGKIEVVDSDSNPIISADQCPGGSFGHVVTEVSVYKSVKFGPQISVKPRLVQIMDSSQPLGAPIMSTEEALGLLPNAAPVAAPAASAPPVGGNLNDLL